MGCSTCKGKSSKNNTNSGGADSENINISLIPESLQNGDFNGNFILKLLALIIIIISWPLITITLFYVLFVNFFIPKRDGQKVIGDLIENVVHKYATFKANRIIKKKERQFNKNRDYSGDSELLDIEVFETEEYNEGTKEG
tara:strand:- start:1771 stop:2193 length:423 start_codon:yes stop_codon:yes gene_type:complete